MSTTSNIVKLNVGGTVYQTTKSTLTKYDGMFRTMFGTDVPIEKDETGCIFIDRSPKHFNLILNFMRDGQVVLPENITDVEEISADAKYFLLEELIEKCRPVIERNNLSKRFRHVENKEELMKVILTAPEPVVLFTYPTNVHLDHLRIPDDVTDFEHLMIDCEGKVDFYFLVENKEENDEWRAYFYKNGTECKEINAYRQMRGFQSSLVLGVRNYLESVGMEHTKMGEDGKLEICSCYQLLERKQ